MIEKYASAAFTKITKNYWLMVICTYFKSVRYIICGTLNMINNT